MNSTALKQQLEAAQQEITKLRQALEKAEKQKKGASAIKLNVPKDGELYTNTVLGYPSIRHEGDMSDYFLYTFASTNNKQAEAFADALAVIAEMRVQEGIVNPVDSANIAISYDIEDKQLEYDQWEEFTGLSLFPCYKDLQAAKLAVETVGEQRVLDCIKTMNFMTPESRGEI